MTIADGLLTAQDKKTFDVDDGELLKTLLAESSVCFRYVVLLPPLIKKEVKDHLKAINKKGLAREMGRLTQIDSNKCHMNGPLENNQQEGFGERYG